MYGTCVYHIRISALFMHNHVYCHSKVVASYTKTSREDGRGLGVECDRDHCTAESAREAQSASYILKRMTH